MHDYFDGHTLFQGYYFHRRFQMRKDFFMRVVEGVSSKCEYICQRPDARRMLGFDLIQKMYCCISYVSIWHPHDALDENFRMFARTTWKALHEFCRYVMSLYDPWYLHHPTSSDIQKLYAHHVNVLFFTWDVWKFRLHAVKMKFLSKRISWTIHKGVLSLSYDCTWSCSLTRFRVLSCLLR